MCTSLRAFSRLFAGTARNNVFAPAGAIPAVAALAAAACVPVFSAVMSDYDDSIAYRVELPPESPVGPASIREHAVVWHPGKRRYYLVADVVPRSSPHHPNTYDTELHLWSSPDLSHWTYRGVCAPKGVAGRTNDGYGVASPAGIAFFHGKIYAPFSARKTAAFTRRSIGLAWSSAAPERVPWTKASRPVSDLPGEDDDAAVVVVPGDDRLHLFHRRTGPGGYRIVHTSSATPEDPDSWPPATPCTPRPAAVRAQELTGAVWADGAVHLFVIEHLYRGGIHIAHLASADPDATFPQADPARRYLERQPDGLAYSGHFTPVVREGRFVAFFWTVFQRGERYGLLGHPVKKPLKYPADAAR